MANEKARILWDNSGVAVSFGTLTNLHSLPDTNIWQSAVLTRTNPVDSVLRIFYELHPATPSNNDSFNFYHSVGSKHASNEIWPGRLTEGEAKLSTAAAKLDVTSALRPVRNHPWYTNQTEELHGYFDLYNPGIDNIILIEALGCALDASANDVQYLWGTIQSVA